MADWAAALAELLDASADAPRALLAALADLGDGDGGAAAGGPLRVQPCIVLNFLIRCDAVRAALLAGTCMHVVSHTVLRIYDALLAGPGRRGHAHRALPCAQLAELQCVV